ncbi:hypothetical protein V8D89_000541 [Ganoderma adspersum]
MAPPHTLTPFSRGEAKVNSSALEITSDFARNAANSAVLLSLASTLFGIMTMLTLAAVVFLIHQRSLSQNQVRVVLPTTLFLYASTAMHMGALIWNTVAAHNVVLDAAQGLSKSSGTYYEGQQSLSAFEDAFYAQSWMITLALAANITTGDAIVWWRAHAIWQGNMVVACAGLLLLTATLVSGVVGICTSKGDRTALAPSLVFTGNWAANLSTILTLATNVIATSLIAYKAWEHRESVKACFGPQRLHSQVLKALALVVESGLIYSALLAFAVVYQASPASLKQGVAPGFVQAEQDFTYGCLALIVAIYPTTIVVIVALNRSITDSAFLHHAAALPESSMLVRLELPLAELIDILGRLSGTRFVPERAQLDVGGVLATPIECSSDIRALGLLLAPHVCKSLSGGVEVLDFS